MKNEYLKTIKTMNRTIKKYNMIQPKDKIAVGISGGKDSLTLLTCLAEWKKHQKIDFELIAIAVDIFGNTDYDKIEKYCKTLDIPLFIEKTNINQIVFDIRKEKNPCSLCANMRRGILNSKAKEFGCNKVALGHHADDLIETFFLCMTKENRLATLFPVTYLSRQNLYVIRPLINVFEHEITSKSKNFEVIENLCSANKHSQREEMKKIICDLEKRIPNFKKNTLSALVKTERYKLLDKCDKITSSNT